MNIEAPFGFVTGCHAGDKFMVQATLASMRHYCPDVPICLVVDGDFDVSDLELEYGLIVLRISDLPSEEMRRMIGGNYRAKLAAMWEGPFEWFVWLDADAIVWGDFTAQIRSDLDFQIFWKENEENIIEEKTTPDLVPDGFKHYYFDPDLLKKFDPDFHWHGKTYFCSGTFACRKNAITFSEWQNTEAWLKETPGLFSWGEMGMLNYIVHSKTQRGEIKSDSTDLQHVWVHHGKEELVEDCIGAGWNFPPKIARPRIAHFCGRKPLLHDTKAFSQPFTIARLTHQRTHHSELGSWMAILREEIRIIIKKAVRKVAITTR
jgi:hypothetical protein